MRRYERIHRALTRESLALYTMWGRLEVEQPLTDTDRQQGFWQASPPAAKWALAAAAVLAVVAVVPFLVTLVMVSLERQLSPLTVIFGPMPGAPLIVWLATTIPPTVIQVAAALALRRSRAATQIAGVVGVLILATIAFVWLGAIVILGVRWLVTGALAGDFYDLLGMVFFALPILLAITALNLRAAFLAVGDLRGHAPHLHAA